MWNSSSEWDPDLSGQDGDATGSGAFTVEFEMPLLILVCLLGFPGNLTTVLVYTKLKYRRSNAAVYILSLAVGDLLALVVVIFHITEFLTITWPILWAYDWQCALHRYFRFVGFNNTVLTMTAIAVDRYYAVRHPMIFRTRFTIRRTRVMAASVWVTSLVAALPTAFMFQSIYGGTGEALTYPGKIPFACKLVNPFGPWFTDFKAIYLNVVLFYLPVIITAIIYVFIVRHVWKNNKFVQSQMGTMPRRNTHWKTAKTLLMVFVVYVACYLILITYNLLAPYAPHVLPPEVKNVGLILPYVNSCMNPIVYSFTNPSFRKACVKMFGCAKCQLARSETSSTSTDVTKENDENSSADETQAKANSGSIPQPSVSVISKNNSDPTTKGAQTNVAQPVTPQGDTFI